MSGVLVEEERSTCKRSKRCGMNREKRDYLPWALEEDKVLLDLLVEQVHKGRKQDNLFTREAWDELVPKFNKVVRTNKTKSNMTNRMKTWKKTYSVISDVIEYGFVWDESNKMITTSDAIWEAYIKKFISLMQGRPEAKIYRYRPILDYKKLWPVVANRGDDLSNLDDDDDTKEKTTCTQSLDSCLPANDVEEILSEKPPFIECSLNEETQLVLVYMLVDQMQHEDDEKSIVPIESQWNEVLPCLDSSNNVLEGAKSEESSDLLWSLTDDKLLLDLLAEEVHPEAQRFRDKTFSNYNALEVIFSHSDTSTVYFSAMQTYTGFQTADGCAMRSSSPNRSPYAFWSSREDKFLLHLFVEQVHRGMTRKNMFAKEAWKEGFKNLMRQRGPIRQGSTC